MATKLENIKKLLDLNGGTKVNELLLSNILETLKIMNPNFIVDESKIDLGDIINEIMEKIIPIYEETFTEEEISGILDFYESKVGKAYLSKMGIITNKSIEVGTEFGEIIYKKIIESQST
jgi:hypothetical protein